MKSIMARTFALAAAIAVGVALPASAAAATSGDAVVPYKIQVPDAVLTDLKARLARTRFPDEIPGTGWDYGANLGYMKELITYWRDKYDWRAQEKRLNQFDQFTTNIDGLNIHFVHQRSKVPNARALLLLNGWPGSIEEFAQVIGPLTDPVAHGGRAEDAFNVIVPDMPGYAFFRQAQRAGLLAGAHRQHVGDFDGPAGLHEVRRPGDRLGRVRRHLARVEGCRSYDGPAFEHLPGRPSARAANRHAARADDGRRGSGVRRDSKHESGNLGLRPQRLAGRAGRVDRRKIPRVERRWRQRRVGVHERSAPHQHHDLLGHRFRPLFDAPVLRSAPSRRPLVGLILRGLRAADVAGKGHGADRLRQLHRPIRPGRGSRRRSAACIR